MSEPTYPTYPSKWISGKPISGCDCDKCNGTGNLSGAACDKCDGTGKVHIWKWHPVAGDGKICVSCGVHILDCDD